MRAADDDSHPFGHSSPFGMRAPSSWRSGYLFFLIALGGAYGLLLLAGRWSPSFASLLPWPALDMNEQFRLPLFAQLASLFSGLAALVVVLSRAVRAVDTRPYLAIAPVIAVFAGLVHAGLRVDLSASGLSSVQVAFGALAVALLGGALITRDGARDQRFGWLLVLTPGMLVLLVLTVTKAAHSALAPSELVYALAPSELAYLMGLSASTLLLGIAGVAARRMRAHSGPASRAVTRVGPSGLRSRARGRASTSGADARASTHAGQQPISRAVTLISARAAVEHDDSFTDFLRAETEEPSSYADADGTYYGAPRRRAKRVLRARVQTIALSIAVALAAYFGVDRLRQGSSVPPAAGTAALLAAAGPPVVEQLATTGKEGVLDAAPAQRRERSDKPRGSKSATHSAETAPVAMPAPAVATSRRAISSAARPKAKPARAARSLATRKATRASTAKKATAPKSAALPAWGAEAMREFAPEQAGKRGPARASKSPEPTASKPVSAPLSPAQPVLAARPPFGIPTKVAPPAALPKPAAPPPPSKPLTLNQLLNKVDDAAHAQRKGKPGSSGQKSKGDSELDDLINKAVQTKGK